MNLQEAGRDSDPLKKSDLSDRNVSVLGESAFQRMISLERKRSERSRKPFALMLLDAVAALSEEQKTELLAKTVSLLTASTRETDVTGWYRSQSVVGVMFTEIVREDRNRIANTILLRLSERLGHNLSSQQFDQLSISFYLFPDDWDHQASQTPASPTLYPDLVGREGEKRVFSLIKRFMDVAGGAALLVMLSPVFLLVAVAIKLTSKGPVLFRQQRVGHYGKPFSLLKFRSMYMHNDAAEHKAYVRKLIAGQAERKSDNGNGEGIYKLTDDRRVTWIGSILRRTSLDELPQLLNVLKGEMSLVGPRPPIDYEVEAYDAWHLRRLVEVKPGITGLWQVNGRSRVTFDEMVRLDLRYAMTWSPWLDLKILVQTPKAVIAGDGAV